ncbi:single-stranded DNA-binding protein [Alteribacter aurantiacus]|uniref:single-stranded DNA-binding protein n=1 Tax=Alteribacter aurantiacus TaxID=254410 RepID=UPI0004110A6B|nr:single-stranded DNA-binding protein [Alteribacter aurantiacus]
MLNQVNLIGRIVKDPELVYTKDGVPLSRFSLAVKRSYKNQSGNYDADFIPCTIFRNNAEKIAEHCGKGSMVAVSGRLQSKVYENSDNKRIFRMDMIAEDVQFLQLKKTESSTLQEAGAEQ